MEIRISGKNESSPGYKSLSAWIRETKDKREVLIINLGEVKVSIYPFDRFTVKQLGEKLQEIVNC